MKYRPISKIDHILYKFKPKRLNPAIWDNNSIIPIVRSKLLYSAMLLVKEYDVPTKFIKDIIITGSMAGHLWHTGSDIDVHIIVDINDDKIDRDLFKQLLSMIRLNWAIDHKQMISEYPVEIYFQDSSEPFITQGVFSLINNKWLITPSGSINISPDGRKVSQIVDKYRVMVDKVNKLYDSGDFENSYNFGKRIVADMKRMRSIGLKSAGQASVENTAYKIIRSIGIIKNIKRIVDVSFSQAVGVDDDMLHVVGIEIGHKELKDISDFVYGIKFKKPNEPVNIFEDTRSLFSATRRDYRC